MTVLANPNDTSLIAGNLGSFFAYAPSFNGGVFVASGDVNGDGIDDLVTGAGEGGGPHVLIFTNASSNPIGGFFAYGTNFSGGVRVGAVDLNGDQFDDIVTGAGPGGGPHVRIISGHVLSTFGATSDLASFFAYNPSFAGGVYVAGSDPRLSGGSPLFVDDAALSPLAPSANATDAALAEITSAAINRFEAAGLSSAGLTRLASASVEFADLRGTLLGLTVGNRVLIDADAAGFGYFVDATPLDDLEFLVATGQANSEEARGRVDLLTVVLHELAHVLGAFDKSEELDPEDILAARLAPGMCRIVRTEDLVNLGLAFSDESQHVLVK